MNDWCPGAVRSPQPGGGGLDTSLPPRTIWHITWDALKPDGSQPEFSAVSGYLKNVGYCPTIMWNPFTGYMEQYYPASESARALVAWNQDGAANVQVEVFFTPGCVVGGVKYATVADTPLVGFDTLLAWMDSLNIPRVWPLGSPQWSGNSRDPLIWNAQAGHYGHCNVPDNTHTDPGPMPSLNRAGITAQGAITPQEDTLSQAEVDQIYKFTMTRIQQAQDATIKAILDELKPWIQGSDNKTGDRVIMDARAQIAAVPNAVLNAQFKLADGTVTNLAGILSAINAKPVTGAAASAAVDPHTIESAVVTAIRGQFNK
jgi:hypothetical protein